MTTEESRYRKWAGGDTAKAENEDEAEMRCFEPLSACVGPLALTAGAGLSRGRAALSGLVDVRLGE